MAKKSWLHPSGVMPWQARYRRQRRLDAALASGQVRRIDPNKIAPPEAIALRESVDPIFAKVVARMAATATARRRHEVTPEKPDYGETADDALRVAMRLEAELKAGK